VLNRAIRQGTDNVVICRLRFRMTHLAPDEQADQAAPASPPAPASPSPSGGPS
jgi:hypothetical protein